ncbi:alcohol dehydrogenase catalytic domain-containing protein [Treponema sp. OMZ 840]|uniref:zinc-dependent alcohol dehydrogenase n=1 Tax=Treponema sp. OMZ 840 TaxID=244313 RepID=UPI003D8B8EC1
MKAAIIQDERKIQIINVSLPEIKDDEVLVKVVAVGLCTFEQGFYFGHKKSYPFAGGHEIAGIVRQVGKNVSQKLKEGDNVAVLSLTRCGQCYACRQGFDNQCENNFDVEKIPGYAGPGGFAEYFIAKDYEVYKLHEQTPLKYAVLTEPLACVCHSLDLGKPEMGDNVLVSGAGFMGALHILLLKKRGCRVLVSEPNELRRKKALALGADMCVDPINEDVKSAVDSFTAGKGLNKAFFTAGGKTALEQAIAGLSIRGVLVVYGSTGEKDILNIDPRLFHYREITITGVTKHTKKSIQTAVDILMQKDFAFERFLSKEVPFCNLAQGFEMTREPDMYRVLAFWEE